MTMPAGTRLGAYEITGVLGAGGMGEVYLAHDSRLDRRVAIKALPDRLDGDPTARERLRREALAAAALDHPFVCKVFEFLEDGPSACIVMEFIEGETLHDRLRGGPLPLADGLRVAGEIADALEAAHARGLVHRDLKPANVMLTGQGRVKVMDFGLARQAVSGAAETMLHVGPQTPLTEEGVRVGTPDYMSPEQALGGDLDSRSDLFSFGILLCEMLMGAHPFRRTTSSGTLAAIVRDEPSLAAAAALPPAVALVLRRLLAKNPADRYQVIADVRTDLAALSGMSGSGPSVAVGRADMRFPLVGRDTERLELLRGLDGASSGHGSLAVISGEPGIGKTRLTAEVLAEARRRGFLCFVGHCYEMEGAPPYVPFVEMLEYSGRNIPPAGFRRALGGAASAVSKLMPELRRMFPDIPPPPELPAEQQRRYLFNAYLEYVQRACHTTPIAVVLEDLHWADEPTLMLLQHVVQNADSLRLFMMATYRDVELDASRPFARTLETLLRERRATRLSLRRLPVQAVEEMLGTMSGHTPPPSLARIVFDETEGNPFFVEEVFQHLAEEGRLFDDTGNWRRDLQARSLVVPESVRLVIGRRLERLGEAARAILPTAAIIGRTFSLALLEALATDPDAALDAIEEAERAQLVVSEPAGRETRYRFAHELIRQTLVESVSLPRRQRQHARIAEALERVHVASLDKQASVLAHHLYQAGAAADRDKTTKYLRVAASQARAAAGFEEALADTDRALSLWEGEEDAVVAALLAERAAMVRSLGRTAEAIEAYRRSVAMYERLDDHERAAQVGIDLAWSLLWEADGAEACRVVDRSVARLGSSVPTLRCRLLLCKAMAYGGLDDAQGGLDALEEAKAIGQGIDDRRIAQETQTIEAVLAWSMMRLPLAQQIARELTRRAEAAGNDYAFAEVRWIEAGSHLHLGHLEEAERMCTGLVPRAERAGHYNVAWIGRSFLSLLRFMGGDLDGARASAQASLEFARTYRIAWGFFDTQLLGIIAMCRGEAAAASAYLLEAANEQPPTYWAGMVDAYLFLHLAMEGDPAAMDRLRNVPPPPVPGEVARAGAWFAVAPRVRGLSILGRRDEVIALLPATEALLETGLLGHFWSAKTTAAIAAAAAGRWSVAEDLHQASIAQADTIPFVFARPETRDWYARMLVDRGGPGDADRARALFGEAIALYSAMGMGRAAERCGSLIPNP